MSLPAYCWWTEFQSNRYLGRGAASACLLAATLLLAGSPAWGDSPSPKPPGSVAADTQAAQAGSEAGAPAPLHTGKLGQLIPPERLAELRQALPKVDSPELQDILNDPELFVYTKEEIPAAYQNWKGVLPGVHTPEFNISADKQERFGNGNVEFPWGRPLGTHRCENVVTFNFIWLPLKPDGKREPIVYFPKKHQGDHTVGYSWAFPVGTVVGEVLGMELPSGRIVTFELRIRTRELRDWGIDLYRPYPTPESLAAAIKEFRPEWQQQAALTAVVDHLESNSLRFPLVSLKDSQPLQRVFQGTGLVDTLPGLPDEELLIELLSQKAFVSCLGMDWRSDAEGNRTSAPTTAAALQVVPRNYDAGFVNIDRYDCSQCHTTVGQHVDDFDFHRDWYGRIRGSDGIFSFHPFEPSCISPRGIPGKAVIRQELVTLGLISPYEPRLHTADRYSSIPELVK